MKLYIPRKENWFTNDLPVQVLSRDLDGSPLTLSRIVANRGALTALADGRMGDFVGKGRDEDRRDRANVEASESSKSRVSLSWLLSTIEEIGATAGAEV